MNASWNISSSLAPNPNKLLQLLRSYSKEGPTTTIPRLLKSSDPSATAGDLRTLISLLVKGEGNEELNLLMNGNEMTFLQKDEVKELLPPTANLTSTPEGFPLRTEGYLGLNHPNLQFHQALHHLLSNGTPPPQLNVTSRTNVVNVFVLNVLPAPAYSHGSSPPLRVPEEIKPIIKLEEDKLHNTNGNNNNKPIAVPFWPVMMSTKGYKSSEVSTSTSPSPSSTSPLVPFLGQGGQEGDKVNILELLPGDLNSFTKVQWGLQQESENNNNQNNKNPLQDFLPDRSRDPQGQGEKSKEEEEGSSKIPAFLLLHRGGPQGSLLNNNKSSLLPAPSSSYLKRSTTPLPPELAHLEWIFRNEKPPKPNVPKKDPVKNFNGPLRPGTLGSVLGGSSSSIEDSSRGDATMEMEESKNSLGGVAFEIPQLSFSSKLIESTTSTKSPISSSIFAASLLQSNLSSSTNNNSSTPPPPSPPAFSKFGIKIPPGGFNDTDELPHNRLRRVMTALGYSAIPTLAAGAAATWPYWIPLVVTGRRRRRSPEPLTFKSSLPSYSPLHLKEVKADEGDSSGEKWTKIAVFNSKEEDLPLTSEISHSPRKPLVIYNISSSSSDSSNEDVPLLKNFLKNVLSNEFTSTTPPPPPPTPSLSHFNNPPYKIKSPNENEADELSFESFFGVSPSPKHPSFKNKNRPLVITTKGPTTTNDRNDLIETIRSGRDAYVKAALLSLWFPIFAANGGAL